MRFLLVRPDSDWALALMPTATAATNSNADCERTQDGWFNSEFIARFWNEFEELSRQLRSASAGARVCDPQRIHMSRRFDHSGCVVSGNVAACRRPALRTSFNSSSDRSTHPSVETAQRRLRREHPESTSSCRYRSPQNKRTAQCAHPPAHCHGQTDAPANAKRADFAALPDVQ